MATKAKPKKKGSGSAKGSGSRKKAAAPSQNWRVVRVVTGLIFAVLALYTFAVLLSYIFTWSKDASLVSNPQMLDASQGVNVLSPASVALRVPSSHATEGDHVPVRPAVRNDSSIQAEPDAAGRR